MADKGTRAHLVIPPLLKQKVQFSEGERDQTRSIANLRIHVERFMERIKNYHIFDRAFPISMTKVVIVAQMACNQSESNISGSQPISVQYSFCSTGVSSGSAEWVPYACAVPYLPENRRR